MRDVASSAGVSLKTVSRVINGEAAVAPATAARVTDAIAELGFERNDLARSLRSGHSSGPKASLPEGRGLHTVQTGRSASRSLAGDRWNVLLA